MLFPTIQFAIFFAVVLTANWVLAPRAGAWKLFMLGASYVFYGAWDWRFVFLLIASTAANQAAAMGMARTDDDRERRGWLMAAVAANLGILGWFKYYGFFASSAYNALGRFNIEPPLPLLEIVLPVGISFFTFQALSYVIDVYRRTITPATPIDFAVYLAFFPQLVAGPIVRASEFLPQLRRRRDPGRIEGARAFGLIAGGLFKKVVVANVLATELVDAAFAAPEQYSAVELLVATYGYAVQIYADFSGYTDIAIGVALLLGFRFPQNFDRPYVALSIQDFWRRWHITLSRWLRDYLYIPLGGNQRGEQRTYVNLMATMVLGGLWHGAAWTFVVWGALHGVMQAVGRWRRSRPDAVHLPDTPVGRGLARLATFHLVCLAWIFFRSDSFTTAWTILTRIATAAGGGVDALTLPVLILIALGIGVQFVPRDIGVRLQTAGSRLRPVPLGLMLGAALLVLDALGPQGVAPFIYFQF